MIKGLGKPETRDRGRASNRNKKLPKHTRHFDFFWLGLHLVVKTEITIYNHIINGAI